MDYQKMYYEVIDAINNYETNPKKYFSIRNKVYELYNYYNNDFKLDSEIEQDQYIFNFEGIKKFEKEIKCMQSKRMQKYYKIYNALKYAIKNYHNDKSLFENLLKEKDELLDYYTNGEWDDDYWASCTMEILNNDDAPFIAMYEFEELINEINKINQYRENDRYQDKLDKVKLLIEKLDYKGMIVANHNIANIFMSALDCTKDIKTNKYKYEPLANMGNSIINLVVSKQFYYPSYIDDYYLEEGNEEYNSKMSIEQIDKYTNKEYLNSIVEELELYKYLFDDNYFYTEETKDLIHIPEYDIIFKSIIGALYFASKQTVISSICEDINSFVKRILKIK